MTSKLLALNITYAIVDTIIAALAICAFGWGAWFFGRWWIILFTIIPLVLFNTHSAIVDADIEATQKGGEDDAGRSDS
jgi:hypothetical protein